MDEIQGDLRYLLGRRSDQVLLSRKNAQCASRSPFIAGGMHGVFDMLRLVSHCLAAERVTLLFMATQTNELRGNLLYAQGGVCGPKCWQRAPHPLSQDISKLRQVHASHALHGNAFHLSGTISHAFSYLSFLNGVVVWSIQPKEEGSSFCGRWSSGRPIHCTIVLTGSQIHHVAAIASVHDNVPGVLSIQSVAKVPRGSILLQGAYQ